MDAGWAAVIGASIAAVVSLVTVLMARAEPRVLKELKTLNEVITASPEKSAARVHLEARRDRIAKGYGENPLPTEAKLVAWSLIGGLVTLAIAAIAYTFVTIPAEDLPTSGPLTAVGIVAVIGATLVGIAITGVAGFLLYGLFILIGRGIGWGRQAYRSRRNRRGLGKDAPTRATPAKPSTT